MIMISKNPQTLNKQHYSVYYNNYMTIVIAVTYRLVNNVVSLYVWHEKIVYKQPH